MLQSMSSITRNLRRVYNSATVEQSEAGLAWYPVAHGIAADLAKHFKVRIEDVCNIIAGLSPMCSWERNLERVREYLVTGKSPGLPLATNGLKVKAFAESIQLSGMSYKVCVDRHMIAAALTKSPDRETLEKVFKSPPRIRNIQRAVSLIADDEGIWPAQCQAIIWVVQRGKA